MYNKSYKAMYLSLIAMIALASTNALNTKPDKCRTPGNNASNELKGPWPLLGGKNLSNSGISFDTKIHPPFEIAWERLQNTVGGVAVRSQPTLVGDVLYYANTGGNVFAVNAKTGDVIWETNLPGQLLKTSPSVVGGYVYIGQNILYALDATTGDIKWSASFSAPNNSLDDAGNTTIVGEKVIVGVASDIETTHVGTVICYNRFTGEKLWQFNTAGGAYGPGGGVWDCPAVDPDRGLIFVGTGQAYAAPASPLTDSILALDLNTTDTNGKLVWSYAFTYNDVYSATAGVPGTYDHDVSGHPILFSTKFNNQDVDLVGISSKDGTYRIFFRDQLNPDYVQPLAYLRLDPSASVQGIATRAIAHDGVLYVASTALIGRTGARESLDYGLTNPDEANTYLTELTSIKTLALDIGKLLQAGNTGGQVPKDAIIWETTTMPGLAEMNPLSFGNHILYQTSLAGGWVSAIDEKTGAVLWKNTPQPLADPSFPIQGATECTSGVTIGDDMIYIGLGFEVYGLALPGGGIVAYKQSYK